MLRHFDSLGRVALVMGKCKENDIPIYNALRNPSSLSIRSSLTGSLLAPTFIWPIWPAIPIDRNGGAIRG